MISMARILGMRRSVRAMTTTEGGAGKVAQQAERIVLGPHCRASLTMCMTWL